VTQAFDGLGQVIKGYGDAGLTYYLHSTPLGGRVLTELVGTPVGELPVGAKVRGYVYDGGVLVAKQQKGGINYGSSWVEWQHQDDLTGSLAISSNTTTYNGLFTAQQEQDPLGANVGLNDPLSVPPDPEAGESRLLDVPGFLPDGRCKIDGVVTGCAMVGSLLSMGAAVLAPQQTTRWNFTTKMFENFRATAQGSGWADSKGRWVEDTKSYWSMKNGTLTLHVDGEDRWEVESGRREYVSVVAGEVIGVGGLSLSQYNKGVQKKKAVIPPPVDPKLKSPCYGKNASDLDYDHVNTYKEGKTVITETGKEHILRNHTVPTQISVGWAGPSKLEMAAGFMKKSLYGSSRYITDTELFDNIRLLNSKTRDFGTLTMQTDPATGVLKEFVFQYRALPAVSTSGNYINLDYVGVEYNRATKTVSPSQYNTLILAPDCNTVLTSFPGR
jgi:hypothetical protein